MFINLILLHTTSVIRSALLPVLPAGGSWLRYPSSVFFFLWVNLFFYLPSFFINREIIWKIHFKFLFIFLNFEFIYIYIYIYIYISCILQPPNSPVTWYFSGTLRFIWFSDIISSMWYFSPFHIVIGQKKKGFHFRWLTNLKILKISLNFRER